jgi:alcohol dehydrogenase (cytochrome c)
MVQSVTKARGRHALIALATTALCSGLISASAQEVTPQRLLNADKEPQNWLLPYRTYDAHNHSSLSEINKGNVANLKVKFLMSVGGMNTATPTGAAPTFQSTPLVVDGLMYVHNGWGQVLKIDLRSGTKGQILWIHDPKVDNPGAMRGSIALLGKFLYHNTSGRNPRLIKVDTDSGKTVWDVSILPPKEESVDTAPSVQVMVVKDKLLVANRGTRGSIAAYSPEDGKMLWRFWTVPGPGDKGHETWADTWGAWKTGGAPLWTQGSFDPESNLVYYGVAEAKPWGDPEFRPGDNLYSNSVVALDVDTGKLGWHYQVVPNDTHDRDNVSMRMLYDISVNGATRKVLGQFTRGGFYYTWDRRNGEFIHAEPYTEVNWTKGIDPKTGKPLEYDPKVQVQMYGENKSLRAGKPEFGQNVCPNWIGSPTLMPPTFDSGRMMTWVGAASGCFSSTVLAPYEHKDVPAGTVRNFPGLELFSHGPQRGRIAAVDVRTGKLKAEKWYDWPLYSGMLGTAGDLLFTAQADGKIMALDKDTLNELWTFDVGTTIAAPPITYSVNGKQFVAIAVGGALYRPADFNTQALTIIQRNAQIVVFGL